MANTAAFTEPEYLTKVLQMLLSATNQSTPAYGGSVTPGSTLVRVASGAIGVAQVTVAHGLSFTPKIYSLVMTTVGIIYQSAAPDATNVYLAADAAARQCYIWVGY